MPVITREYYIQKTLRMAEEASSEGYKAKYWELAGRALGYLDPPKIENQNIAIFQNISSEMIAFLKTKAKDYVEVSTENMIPSLPTGPVVEIKKKDK